MAVVELNSSMAKYFACLSGFMSVLPSVVNLDSRRDM